MKNRTRDKIKAPKWSFNWDLTILSLARAHIYWLGFPLLLTNALSFLSSYCTVQQWVKIKSEVTSHIYKYLVQEIQPWGLHFRIGDMEANCYNSYLDMRYLDEC